MANKPVRHLWYHNANDMTMRTLCQTYVLTPAMNVVVGLSVELI